MPAAIISTGSDREDTILREDSVVSSWFGRSSQPPPDEEKRRRQPGHASRSARGCAAQTGSPRHDRYCRCHAAGAIALRCAGLVKRYADVVAVNGLDLEVRTGECFGLLGPNGAGKTTTIEILEGLTRHDAGDVEVLGHRWGRRRWRAPPAPRDPAPGNATERQALGRGDAAPFPLVLRSRPQHRRGARDRRARVEAYGLGREALRRPEATARHWLRARRPARSAVSGRAHDRPRSPVTPAAVDTARGLPSGGRHHPADDPLHGRSAERSATASPWSITGV